MMKVMMSGDDVHGDHGDHGVHGVHDDDQNEHEKKRSDYWFQIHGTCVLSDRHGQGDHGVQDEWRILHGAFLVESFPIQPMHRLIHEGQLSWQVYQASFGICKIHR